MTGTSWITGADQKDRHVFNLVAGRDFTPDGVIDVAEIREGGGDAQAIAHNVSDIVSSGRLVEQTLALYGRLDILICNAAVNPYWGAMASMPEEAYDKVMEANVKSNFLLGLRRPMRWPRGAAGAL